MKYIPHIILTFILTISVNAQINIKPYEQVAMDYFAKEITITYKQLNYFVFNGFLETDSSLNYSFCIHLDKIEKYEETENTKINVPTPQIIRKLGFFKRIFISEKKIGNIIVFKYYPKDNNVVVVICLSTKNIYDFYSILIDTKTNKVTYYCKETFFE